MKYRIFLALFLCLSVATGIVAQSKLEEAYKLRAAEVREEIWNMDDYHFSVSKIPEQLKNESAVVIAKSYEVTNTSKSKLKVGIGSASMAVRVTFFTTIRQRVWINDKSALDDFSTIEYKKTADNSTSSIGFIKYLDTYAAFLGVKIFKKDGNVIEVNADEEVLTKNDDDGKEGRLAIPDLQVGDILDYYIRIEKVVENTGEQGDLDYIFLGGEYPMLYYHVRYDLSKNNTIHVVQANDAKPLKVSKTDEGNILMEFVETDLPKFEEPIWTNLIRQYPYYGIRYFYSPSSLDIPVIRDTIINLYNSQFNSYFSSTYYLNYKSLLIGKYGNYKKVKEQPLDSMLNYIYSYFKWKAYEDFDLNNIDITQANGVNDRDIYSLQEAFKISSTLRAFDIDHELIMSGSKKYNPYKNAMMPGDIYWLIRINHNGNIHYLSFNDFFNLAGELPAEFQGEDAAIFGRENMFSSNIIKTKLPLGNSADNGILEDITVKMDLAASLDINVDRTCHLSGNMKLGDQKYLLLAEDIEAIFAGAVGEPKKVDRLLKYKYTVAKGNELQAAFDKERAKQKDNFKEEITTQFGQEPKELNSYKIIKPGLTLQDPVFEYNTNFTMEGFVRKAGQNFIFEVGKLMGEFKRTEEKDRTRKLDIYMSAPRTFTYHMQVAVPAGYKVVGLEELNKTISNDTGSFTCEAAINGDMITIKVNRTYLHAFEKAESWPLLLAHMDAAAAFTEQKILFEKI